MREGLSGPGRTRPGDRVPIAGPWITEREVRYATEAAATAWYDRAGEFTARFETAFARRVERRHAVAVPHATAALHLALLALDIGPGHEVIVPDATWIASVAPVVHVGATPVFADIDPVTWCLTPHTVERCLTPRTRAIVAVDLYGSMPDMDALAALCADHGLVLIEDAAEAIGSTHGNRPAGAFGDASVFSFHGSKTMTTGEGGMLVTDRDDVRDRVEILRDHGRPPGDRRFRNTEVAWKYRMSALPAALGLAQVERLDELVTRKRHLFAWYRDALEGDDRVTLNAEPPGTTNSYWMVTAIVDPGLGLASEVMMDEMEDAGIDTRPFFRPVSSLPAFDGHPSSIPARARNAVAYDIAPRGINLPSGYDLDGPLVERVVEAFRGVLDRAPGRARERGAVAAPA